MLGTGHRSGPVTYSRGMSVPPDERFRRLVSRPIWRDGGRRGRDGRGRRGAGDPLRRRPRDRAPSPVAHRGLPPGRPAHPAAGPADQDRGPARPDHRDPLRREPDQRPAEPDLAEDGQVDRRDRGLPLLPARRPRPEGHAARPGHQPVQRRRGPGWLVDHPADGQDDPDLPGQDRPRSARRPPPTPTPASSASCATRSPSSSTTPRTGSSSATSTSPTSATARTASRRPRGTTSASTPRTSPAVQSRDARRPGEEPQRLRPACATPTTGSSAATSCSTGWPSST